MGKEKYQEFYFRVPAQKVDGNLLVGAQSILNVIDGLDKTETKQESATSTFKDKVKSIWSDCLAHGPKPWENKDTIIGEALMVDYPFDKEKLASHAEEIYNLISLVHTATTYEGMKFLDNGEKWSELRQPVSFLMALGNALKLIDFKNDRTTWNEEESKNPEVTFTLK